MLVNVLLLEECYQGYFRFLSGPLLSLPLNFLPVFIICTRSKGMRLSCDAHFVNQNSIARIPRVCKKEKKQSTPGNGSLSGLMVSFLGQGTAQAPPFSSENVKYLPIERDPWPRGGGAVGCIQKCWRVLENPLSALSHISPERAPRFVTEPQRWLPCRHSRAALTPSLQ